MSAGRPPPPRDPIDRLPVAGAMQLREVLELLAHDRRAPTTVRDPEEAWRTHVVDSLTGLEVAELRAATRIADVGSGAGFPGLALAAALPGSHVEMIESVERKCEFMRLAAERARIDNAHVVCDRAETWSASAPPSGGRESYDAVTARAVGRLSTLAELASPLLAAGGVLVAWKGRRDPEEEAEAQRAAGQLAMAPGPVLAVGELAGFEHRHLYVFRKDGPTPAGLPRKAGMAKKRPLGAV